MENLPPISNQIMNTDEIYTSMLQQRCYDVIRRYQNTRVGAQLKKSPTKKGNFLDYAIKMNCSPGPANNSNIQKEWAKQNKYLVKYSNRKTFIDQINVNAKRRNSPSPNQYNIKSKWPQQIKKPSNSSQKTSFLDNSQYQASNLPGPGSYLIATHLLKKTRQYHYNITKPLQPHKQISASMITYDPIPRNYDTFKSYEKFKKFRNKISTNKSENLIKKNKENSTPGPGQYQMIHTWQGKQKKLSTGSSTYLSRISKVPTTNFYYN